MCVVIPYNQNKWNPEAFSLQLYKNYTDIANKYHVNSYDHLSSGINYLPMNNSLKKCFLYEIKNDLFYTKYTPLKGLQLITSCLQLMHNFIATQGNFLNGIPDNDLCMTIGASQGISMIYRYIKHNIYKPKVLVLGLCFSMFFQLAKAYEMECFQCLNEIDPHILPDVDSVITYIKSNPPDLIVMTVPNNPSGLNYTDEQMLLIFKVVNELGCFLLLDTTGSFTFSKNEKPHLEVNIIQTGMIEKFAIVNSFSKSYSLPGFRIGYIYSCKNVINYIQEQMSRDIIMNPTLVTVWPIIMITMLTCIYINKKENWANSNELIQKMFRKIYFLSSGNNIGFKQEEMVDLIFRPTDFYINDLLQEFSQTQCIIKKNSQYFIEQLHPHIEKYIPQNDGFNMLVQFYEFRGYDEVDAAKKFFENTQLSILTESCFRANKVNDRQFAIRISSAVSPEEFNKQIERIDKCLKKW